MKFKVGLVEYNTEDNPKNRFSPGDRFIQKNGGADKPIVRKQISTLEKRELEHKHGNLTNAMYNIALKEQHYIYSREDAPSNSYLIID